MTGMALTSDLSALEEKLTRDFTRAKNPQQCPPRLPDTDDDDQPQGSDCSPPRFPTGQNSGRGTRFATALAGCGDMLLKGGKDGALEV